MAQNGAIMESLGADLTGALSLVSPTYALIAGLVLGVCIAIGFMKWSPAPRPKADPLSGLFEGGTLESQLTRFADPKSQSEIEDRQASAVRAKMFARKSAMAATTEKTPPHRAERYDHAEVLAHVAKVMRAGTHLDDDASCAAGPDEDAATGEWEEVLLLPPPSTPERSEGVAKAA